ncbi:1-acyl-sn-glycerol-3-phosphate acyltransferase [Porphyromonas circumdentaria]|uniref:Putative hemolysin n=1 Tax=Porphyromonas circumdentaria TaxID=29524 RepID=A0A1T4MUZ1_9PORP|nr:1-acyl-sn-glycerol-3-phosphate acyltransferase [Porphyromonas circumdentaria]MBB6275939.1 1-acyl-sn-glycerol-3-phosphate acyltransferase [Porphyromonas circumdentaria]MDO4721997.1 1-acyl-sn-glycerol-3-phosphate acyltransferase [Porphyromonas circumdentaria]SJZ70647.1 Putative hemolysin [Porphyromonas circumdentaria]
MVGEKGNKEPQQINIGAIISAKWGKKLPRWTVRILERLIHQDEINFILRRYKNLQGVDFMTALVEYFNIQIDIVGRENLPQNPRALFISNHPLGGMDGICLTHVLGTHYQSDIRYIVNDLLFNLQPLKKIFVPVNTLGKQSRVGLERLQEELSSSLPVITFPAGVCSRRIYGKIQDLEWKKSFIRMSVDYQRDIIPIFFEGYNTCHFYKIEQARRKMGMKFNIGTVLLPDEMFRSKGKRYKIYFGEPIPYTALQTSTKNTKELALELRNIVYKLPDAQNSSL